MGYFKEVFDALDTEILDNPKRDEKGYVERWACFMAAKERPRLNIPELKRTASGTSNLQRTPSSRY